MAKKRPEFSFPELEHRGRNAILRSAEEVQAEQALLAERAEEAPSTGAAGGVPDLTTREPITPQPAAMWQEGDLTPARVRARTRVPREAAVGTPPAPPPRAAVLDRLRQKLRVKQHLSSYTFRFRPEELEQLDQLVVEVNQTRTSKLSKNDLVRLALGWLLTDYEEYGQASLVVEVTRQE